MSLNDEDEIKDLLKEMEQGERQSKVIQTRGKRGEIENTEISAIPMSQSHFVELDSGDLELGQGKKKKRKGSKRSKKSDMDKMDDFIMEEDEEQNLSRSQSRSKSRRGKDKSDDLDF